MKQEDLKTLRIHNMSEDKYNEIYNAGDLVENEIYLTPAPNITNMPIAGSGDLITSGGVFEALQTVGGNGDVKSVNGKTGTVNLTASDVGALPNTTVIPTVPTNISAFTNDKGYALTSQIPTVPTKVSAFENDKGYLTQHQSLENYALKTDLNSKQNTLTFDTVPTLDSTNPVTSNGVYSAISDVIAVANGKCNVFVLNTVAELDTFLSNSSNTVNLNTGDIFLIRAVDVPDYWWDKTTQTKQILETAKVPLNDYALKSEIPTVPTNISAFTNDKGYALTSQIPTVPSSLPANGGNADTVDNYHIRIVTTDDGGQAGSITFVIG